MKDEKKSKWHPAWDNLTLDECKELLARALVLAEQNDKQAQRYFDALKRKDMEQQA